MAEPTLSDVMARLATMELKLEQQSALLLFLTIGQKLMSSEVDSLATQVTANTTVEQSALTLIQGIAAQVTDAAGDRTKSLALAATLKASGDALAAAVAANTAAAATPAA